MKNQNEDNIKILNHLIETCKDGARGFSEAAKDAKDSELRSLFNQYSQQRQSFVQELSRRVREQGGDPDKSGSISGAMHRGWIDLKAAISSNEPHAVLAECERGEDVAVDAYRDALEKVTEPGLRQLISSQYSAVQAAHDAVRNLRDSTVGSRH